MAVFSSVVAKNRPTIINAPTLSRYRMAILSLFCIRDEKFKLNLMSIQRTNEKNDQSYILASQRIKMFFNDLESGVSITEE